MRKQIKVEGCINDSNIKTEISHAPIGFSIKTIFSEMGMGHTVNIWVKPFTFVKDGYFQKMLQKRGGE